MPFNFNIYSSLLLPAFIQGVLFAGLLFYRGWKEEKLSDKLLGVLLLLNAFKIASWMLGFAGWYETHNGFTSFMFYFPFNNILLMGPLLYFYFLSLTNTGFKFEKKHWKHFVLPALWVLLIAGKLLIDFMLYSPFPDTEDTQYGTKGPFAELDKSIWAGIISYAIFFYYLVITIKAFRNYQKYVIQNFSATEEIRFYWLRNILYAISAGVIAIFLFTIIAFLKKGGTSYIFNWYAYLFLGAVTYYLSIEGYFAKPKEVKKLHFNEPAISVVEKEVLPEVERWKEKLLEYMEKNKPYLESELTLSTLSDQMKTNTSLLSKVINDGTGRNFNDFINFYRVEEVISKLKAGEQKSQTLLGIAYDAGFNSKATFNRSFKKITGTSPKDWLENNKNK